MIRLSITVDDVQYGALLEKLLPLLAENAAGEAAPILNGIRAFGPGTVDKMPERMKETMAVRLMNQNREKVLSAIETMLEKNDIPVRVADFDAESV